MLASSTANTQLCSTMETTNPDGPDSRLGGRENSVIVSEDRMGLGSSLVTLFYLYPVSQALWHHTCNANTIPIRTAGPCAFQLADRVLLLVYTSSHRFEVLPI
jgi:hypothetical protein